MKLGAPSDEQDFGMSDEGDIPDYDQDATFHDARSDLNSSQETTTSAVQADAAEAGEDPDEETYRTGSVGMFGCFSC